MWVDNRIRILSQNVLFLLLLPWFMTKLNFMLEHSCQFAWYCPTLNTKTTFTVFCANAHKNRLDSAWKSFMNDIPFCTIHYCVLELYSWVKTQLTILKTTKYFMRIWFVIITQPDYLIPKTIIIFRKRASIFRLHKNINVFRKSGQVWILEKNLNKEIRTKKFFVFLTWEVYIHRKARCAIFSLVRT